jgi:hypothetical protein
MLDAIATKPSYTETAEIKHKELQVEIQSLLNNPNLSFSRNGNRNPRAEKYASLVVKGLTEIDFQILSEKGFYALRAFGSSYCVFKPLDFKVGDGATLSIGTDSKAGTIIKVKGKRVVWQEDTAIRDDEKSTLTATVGGFAAHFEGKVHFDYEPNPEGLQLTFSLRKNGRWVQQKHKTRGGSCLSRGRHKFTDYNF